MVEVDGRGTGEQGEGVVERKRVQTCSHNPKVVNYRAVYAKRGKPFGHMTTFSECFVCSLRHGGQARKHVCRQSLQIVALKAEFPVGEEIDTRSDLSTPT